MNTGTYKLSLLASTLAALCLAPQVLSADVVFLDGGYTEMCAAAALDANNMELVVLTGSRLGIDPIEICTRAIRVNDSIAFNAVGNYNNRGVLYFVTGAWEQALADFDEAVRLKETLGQSHVNRAYTLVVLKRWEESIAAFSRGIELGVPELAKAYLNRGFAYEETGQLRPAYSDYLKAVELVPEWEEPKQQLARFKVTVQ